jgi:hypothetical protein
MPSFPGAPLSGDAGLESWNPQQQGEWFIRVSQVEIKKNIFSAEVMLSCLRRDNLAPTRGNFPKLNLGREITITIFDCAGQDLAIISASGIWE